MMEWIDDPGILTEAEKLHQSGPVAVFGVNRVVLTSATALNGAFIVIGIKANITEEDQAKSLRVAEAARTKGSGETLDFFHNTSMALMFARKEDALGFCKFIENVVLAAEKRDSKSKGHG